MNYQVVEESGEIPWRPGLGDESGGGAVEVIERWNGQNLRTVWMPGVRGKRSG